MQRKVSVMESEGNELQDKLAWITPTSAARLLACPASVVLPPLRAAGRPPPPELTPPGNAGSLAHLALRRWVEAEGWREDADAPSLAHFFRDEATRYGIAVEELTDGRLTESRLRAQQAALADAIRHFCGAGGTVLTEKPLYDDSNRLWGTIDLLIRGADGCTIIDLKSGADASAENLPDELKDQLLHYALLVDAEYRKKPQTLAIFSLLRGLRVVGYDQCDLERVMAKITVARRSWFAGHRPATPSPSTCRFCTRRIECEPHWSAVAGWEQPDAVQGKLVRIDSAANGSSSLMLRRDSDELWISDVPTSLTGGLKNGALVRGVRLRRSRRDIHDSKCLEIWYADKGSGVFPVDESVLESCGPRLGRKGR